MVFATDFDPIDSPSTSSPHKRDQARLSPVHQTNRLIAQAAQEQKAAQMAAQKAAQQQSFEDAAADVKVANRLKPSPTSNLASTSPAVAPLRKPKLPLGLKVLNQVQHGSTMVTSVLIAGALVLYGSSVYVDRSVNRTMSHLNYLQSDSQQLTSANESIKQSLAEQAMQENSGLEPYEAGDVLFVAPEPLREENAIVQTEESSRFKPLGY